MARDWDAVASGLEAKAAADGTTPQESESLKAKAQEIREEKIPLPDIHTLAARMPRMPFERSQNGQPTRGQYMAAQNQMKLLQAQRAQRMAQRAADKEAGELHA